MAIAAEDVSAVRGATDLVALVGERVGLRPQGRRFIGLCPFHSERTPSFTVNPDAGFYHCFGCGASGDAITFVRAVEQLDFAGALERLAARAGIVLHADRAVAAERSRRGRLEDALGRAVEWYHQRLLVSRDAARAREYLRSRGYDGETVRQFRLGWAPAEWDACCRALALPADLARDSGLGLTNRAGRLQDFFRGRVLFPIFDPAGRPVAFGGRVLPGQEAGQPKYLNSPDSALYAKRKTLYGLNWAKEDVVTSGEVVVCEGYTDVIALFAIGVTRAVATCGTSLAEDHFGLLRNFARRVVLAYDADRAGQAAAERFYEWERRNELQIAVADLTGGADPADLARSDAPALREAIREARPYLTFRLENVLRRADLSSEESRARAAGSALELVAEHPDELVRDRWVMTVGDRCRMDPDALRRRLGRLLDQRSANRGASQPGRRSGDPGRAAGLDGSGSHATGSGSGERSGERSGEVPGVIDGWVGMRLERRWGAAIPALALAIHRPEEVADRLEEWLFPPGTPRDAFRALAGAGSVGDAADSAAPEVAALLRWLAVRECDDDADDVITKLVVDSGWRLRASWRERVRADPGVAAQLGRDVGWLPVAIEKLREHPGDRETEAELVAFLESRGEEGA